MTGLLILPPPILPTSLMFDLVDADGVSDSERILAGLCRRSFLRLWTYLNLYTDEGFRDGKGSAKELCDALLVFGDQVVIFSDKHVEFHAHKPADVAWKRWYKRAVEDSVRQLHGAHSWLRRFPSRVYQDAACSRPLPVGLPASEAARVHLVAVTRGSREAALAHGVVSKLGSLPVQTSIKGLQQHLETPFHLGLPDSQREFVHVFDEVGIEEVLTELDTAADFLRYLNERRKLLGDSKWVIAAHGEEDLLAAYLCTVRDGEHTLMLSDPDSQPPTHIFYDDSWHAGLTASPRYKAKKEEDRRSYLWDTLISHFIAVGDPGLVPLPALLTSKDVELGLRIMAAESRFGRRVSSESLADVLQRARGRNALVRLMGSPTSPHVTYVFLVLGKQAEESYEEYRQRRVALLHAYCQTGRLAKPNCTTFVGLGFDHPDKTYEGGSEDLLVWHQEVYTAQELEEIEKLRQAAGILGPSMELRRYSGSEFPDPTNSPKPPRANNERARKKKQAVETSAASRKRNRKRK